MKEAFYGGDWAIAAIIGLLLLVFGGSSKRRSDAYFVG
jgi:hypothetical protein